MDDFHPTEAFVRHIKEGLAEADAGRLLSFEEVFDEPIDYERAVSVLRKARRVDEEDSPVGGPFGA